MGNRSRYRKLADLYVDGTELVLEDGLVMWLQAMNPFEVEEARRDASVARARFALAVRKVGSPEYDQLEAIVNERGRDLVIDDLCGAKQAEHFLKVSQKLEADPEWRERYEIMNRSDDLLAREDDDPEKLLLAEINAEWVAEINRLVKEEQDWLRETLERLDFEGLVEEYQKEFIDVRGNSVALQAYNVTEVFLSTRTCEAQQDEDGFFPKDAHAGCNHKEHVFESKDEVRELPDRLYTAIRKKLDDLVMSIRDAKNSDRRLSSSGSSQQPAPAEA